MKRKLLDTRFLKQTALAVPAAALMLGAAQAGTTVGLNFQAWYYDSGTTPQTVGYGSGYQTTGFPVTAKAFGIAVGNWFNTDPLDCQSAISTSVTFGGTLTAQLAAPNAWQSGIGAQVAGWNPETVAPGNDEVTWGYLDDGNTTGRSPSAVVSGLASKFPNGYVIQTIAAEAGVAVFNDVDITDGTTTNTVAYSTYFLPDPIDHSYDGTVGLSAPSGKFTADTIQINPQPKTSGYRLVLAGFIITDQPVVTKDPTNTVVNQGSPLSLGASAVGVGSLSYQWRTNGTPVPGATSATYHVASATAADAGSYDVVVTNLYGATTSGVATVTVIQVPVITSDLAGVSGTIFSGANFSSWSVVAGGAAPLHYNWYRGGTPVGTDNATLILTNVSVANSGAYYVVVTNSLGSVKSATNHLTVVASPDSYTTDVASDFPSAYWPLSETSGTLAMDYSGASHYGTNNGGLVLGATGPRPPSYQGFNSGKVAYQFDGSSSYIDCGTGPSLSGTTDFTLEAWINTTAAAAGQMIQQRYKNGYNGEYFLGLNANGNVTFSIYGGGAYQFNAMTSPNSVNDGNWHHIAAVRSNGTTGAIYIDGTVVATQTSTTVAPLDNTFITYIGADMRDSVNYFNGLMSDVAIYSYALSGAQIATHAYTGRLGNSPIVLSTVPGGYAIDSKPLGTAHPGINYGTKWLASVTDNASPTPVTRNGVAQFVNGAQTVIQTNADFNSPVGTICFWMLAGIPAKGNGSMLFDRRTTAGLVLFLDGTPSGGIDVQYTGGTSFAAGGYVVDGNWHHMALTYDQSANGTVTVYVDGVQVGSQANTSAWSWDLNQRIELGRSHDAYWQTYNGDMDDFRIYSRMLTDTEITTIATPATSDTLVDTNALKVRYNFDTAGGGQSIAWPAGSLLTSPTLGPTAVWTPVPGAVSPYPFLPPPPLTPAGTTMFYRVGL